MNDEIRSIMLRLQELKEDESTIADEQKALWGALFAIADKEAGAGKSYRYLNEETGQIIGRILRESHSLDEERLEGCISPAEWEQITILPAPVRVLDQTLLEAALKAGAVSSKVVEECTTVKTVLARHGPRKASKEELAELEEGR